MKILTKKEIREIADKNKYAIYEKRNITLKEDEKNSYVEPSSNSMSSLSSDLAKTKQNNPQDDDFIVNANSYDNKSSNNPITLSVNGKNTSDASQNLKKVMQNPQVKQLISTNNVNAKVHLNNESLKSKSVMFTKKELNKILN